MMYNFIRTLDYGNVVIRKTYTEGNYVDSIQLSDGDHAEIRTDFLTGQLFAVLFDGDWNKK